MAGHERSACLETCVLQRRVKDPLIAANLATDEVHV